MYATNSNTTGSAMKLCQSHWIALLSFLLEVGLSTSPAVVLQSCEDVHLGRLEARVGGEGWRLLEQHMLGCQGFLCGVGI